MGKVELWLGPAGCGKTTAALAVMADELAHDQSGHGWRRVRYLVPTVDHKRSIEHLLLAGNTLPGLFGDPVTTFFNFAEEIAERAQIGGRKLSELQKHLLLKDIVRTARLDYFAPAQPYPGFVQALGEEIDEMKVHMVDPERLHEVADVAREGGAQDFARKLTELGSLYATYQQRVREGNLYDNEGIMWIAAKRLEAQPDLLADLDLIILDGFARLTPIQVEVLRVLASVARRVIVLLNFAPGRPEVNHPVEESITRLEQALGQAMTRRMDFVCRPPQNALQHARIQVFAADPSLHPPDSSLTVLKAATPAQEAELIARRIRALLRQRVWPDGSTINLSDIVIMARNADSVRERLSQTFQRYGLPLREEPLALAHTPAGRALLAALRLVRDGWARRDLLALLKSGFLHIEPSVAFQIDLTARTHYLRERKTNWQERWPDDDTRPMLLEALAPLFAFDDLFHRRGVGADELLAGVSSLVTGFRAVALPEIPPVPDSAPEAAREYVALECAFSKLDGVLDDLRKLGNLLGGFRREEVLEILTTALMRETMPASSVPEGGIPVLSVHAAGGEKFPCVFLCNLLEGAFPQHQRSSAFLLDAEREETLQPLQVPLAPRRHLEDDEQHWFVHALSSATKCLILSYPVHDAGGGRLERSSFLDAVDQTVPDFEGSAQTTSFRDLLPALGDAESEDEFLSALASGIRSERDPVAQQPYAAALVLYPGAQGRSSALAALYRRAIEHEATFTDSRIYADLAARTAPFSASELQQFRNCPFLWFGSALLGIQPVMEEFSAVDRGSIIHGVLEKLYRDRQPRRGAPVHLERFTFEELWPAVEIDLQAALDAEPRFRNRAAFLRGIEWESMRRMMARFLRGEVVRAQLRTTHPAYFEYHFGSSAQAPFILGDGVTRLRGTIDRIDLADDDQTSAVVIDYKSSAAGIRGKDLEAGAVLQAPVYLLAVRSLLQLAPIGAEFLGIKQSEARGVYGPGAVARYGGAKGVKEMEPARWSTYLSDGETQLLELAAGVRRGNITLAPTIDRCPTGCEYWPLCRGNRFLLARRVREVKQEARRAEG